MRPCLSKYSSHTGNHKPQQQAHQRHNISNHNISNHTGRHNISSHTGRHTGNHSGRQASPTRPFELHPSFIPAQCSPV